LHGPLRVVLSWNISLIRPYSYPLPKPNRAHRWEEFWNLYYSSTTEPLAPGPRKSARSTPAINRFLQATSITVFVHRGWQLSGRYTTTGDLWTLASGAYGSLWIYKATTNRLTSEIGESRWRERTSQRYTRSVRRGGAPQPVDLITWTSLMTLNR